MLKIKSYRRAQVATEPKLEGYIIRSTNLFDRDAVLQHRFGSPSSPEFEKFIDTEAVLHYREIQEVGVPFPSSREMLTVGGETDLRLFLSIGYGCYEVIKRHIQENHSKPIKILDFSVGCGRTARFFFRDARQFECFGCDVDEKAIEYLTSSVPFIKATVSYNLPPLPYTENFFNVIYSISVFTHLNQHAFMAWMRELHRVSGNRGLVLVTLHGQLAFSLLDNDPARRQLLGIGDDFSSQRNIFDSTGFTWMKQPVGSSSIDTSQFGISFISRENLAEAVAGLFEIVDYREGEIGGWQDLAILRKVFT